ncbi:hypothetical protein GCM10010123_40740 [Pilimelia anulata]|uniref:DUF4239 domain-containing protein n=1 Tax=Pilimelia anulata TaxID=53371 RepID=A0A8J3BDX6_9ACTN|nr:DUF4239 domain-containing protein [Pilimelia anulata]GGK06842.1 hypothetical protein GCM10010123_40740 [Pilimelia anulata]
MNNFLLDLPLWAVMAIIIAGLTGFAVGLQAVVRRWFPEIQSARHNDVAGFLAAVIGVIYAVTVGFIIAEQWENFTDAKERTYREAFSLGAIAEGSSVLGPEQQARYADAVLTYNRAVLRWWPQQGHTETEEETRDAQTLEPLYALAGQAQVTNEAQRAFVRETTAELGQVARDREDRLHRAGQAHLEWPLWVLIAFASAVVLVFCALFGLESRWLHYTMITGVALAVASNLMLVVLLNHPLSGALRVAPDSYQSVVDDLSGG